MGVEGRFHVNRTVVLSCAILNWGRAIAWSHGICSGNGRKGNVWNIYMLKRVCQLWEVISGYSFDWKCTCMNVSEMFINAAVMVMKTESFEFHRYE